LKNNEKLDTKDDTSDSVQAIDIRPYSTRSSAIHLLQFGKLWWGSVCRVQRMTTKQNA